MTNFKLFCAAFGAALALASQSTPVAAQLTTTYVSRAGNDANNCANPASACRFLPRAYDQVAAGGKIFVLDSGTFAGTGLVISKAISVVAVGVQAQLAGNGVANKIVINAGPNDTVYLDGLSFLGDDIPAEPNGILFNSGGKLHIRNCTIDGFNSAGIRLDAPGPSEVMISNCTIYNNRFGIWARRDGGSGQLKAVIDNVTVAHNATGVRSAGGSTHIRLSGARIVGNNTGIESVNAGRLISFGNNLIADNGVDGAPTHTEQFQ